MDPDASQLSKEVPDVVTAEFQALIEGANSLAQMRGKQIMSVRETQYKAWAS